MIRKVLVIILFTMCTSHLQITFGSKKGHELFNSDRVQNKNRDFRLKRDKLIHVTGSTTSSFSTRTTARTSLVSTSIPIQRRRPKIQNTFLGRPNLKIQIRLGRWPNVMTSGSKKTPKLQEMIGPGGSEEDDGSGDYDNPSQEDDDLWTKYPR